MHARNISSTSTHHKAHRKLRELLKKISEITTGTLLTNDIEPLLTQQITSFNLLLLKADSSQKLTWRQTKSVFPMFVSVLSLIKFYSLLVNFADTQHGTFTTNEEYKHCALLKKLANTLTELAAVAIAEKNRINLLIRDIQEATYKDPELSLLVSKKADLLLETIRDSPDANLLDELTGFDDSMCDEIQAIETRDATIRAIWETCVKQVITSKVLLLIVPTLTNKFQRSQELQDQLTEYSNAVDLAGKMTSHYELTNFRQGFYTWHEHTNATKIIPLRIVFNLLDNIDSCLMSKALNTPLSERFKQLLDLHAPVMPSSLKPDPLLALIHKTTKAFNEFELLYPDIKKALKFIHHEEVTDVGESKTEEPFKKLRRRASSITAEDAKLITSSPRIDPRMQRMMTVSKLTMHYRPKHPEPLSSSTPPAVPQDGVLDMEKVRGLSSSFGKK